MDDFRIWSCCETVDAGHAAARSFKSPRVAIGVFASAWFDLRFNGREADCPVTRQQWIEIIVKQFGCNSPEDLIGLARKPDMGLII